jgi:ParB/RepB/Spo0J family partition protein
MAADAQISTPPVGRFALLPTSDLKPHPRNPRKHSRKQIDLLARSVKGFGFNAPILINKEKQIVGGHCRLEAAKLLGLSEVPVIFLEQLNPAQIDAYLLADNKIADLSSWDDLELATELKSYPN